MIPVALRAPFARRMLPLVIATAVVFAVTVPLVSGVQGWHQRSTEARVQAGQVVRAIEVEVRQRPRLWRYDAVKLNERLQADGLNALDALEVRDALGRPVRVGPAGRPSPLVWAHLPVEVDGRMAAEVWVGRSLSSLWSTTGTLAALCTALAAALGLALYLLPVRTIGQAEQRIAALMAERRVTLQEEERRRIARDLHDGAGQALTAARLHLLALRAGGIDAERLAPVEHHLDEALEEVRRSTTALAPAPLAELGLIRALDRHCRTYAEAAGVSITLQAEAGFPELSTELESGLYRITQEALHNTVRHAAATRAVVRLGTAGDEVRLEVEDDGKAPSAASPQSIRERVAGLGGILEQPEGLPGHLRIRVPRNGADG